MRTIDATGFEGKEPLALKDIVIKSTPKVKKLQQQKFGGQTNNWLNNYINVN